MAESEKAVQKSGGMLEKAKKYAKQGGEMTGKGINFVSKKVEDLKIVDGVVDGAKAVKKKAYDKMNLNEEDRKDADNLGKSVGVLAAAAGGLAVAASVGPALLIGGAVAAGGYVVAKEKAPEHLEKAKEKASQAVEVVQEVGSEFAKGAKEAKEDKAES